MKIEERMVSRLDGLLEKGDRAIKTYTTARLAGEGWIDFTATTLDENLFAEWKTQSLSFLVDSVEEDHVYSQSFRDFVGQAHASSVEKGLGILRAVREDIQNGWLSDLRTLVSAEVFTDFLDMAAHLLEHGYWHPAASLTGAVLEDGLRRIAQSNNVVVKSGDDIGALNQRCA